MRRIVRYSVALVAFAATMGGAVVYWRRNPRVGTAFVNSVVNPGLLRRGLAGAGASELGTLEHFGRKSGIRRLTPVHPEPTRDGFRIVVPLGSWFGTPVGLTAQGVTAAVFIVTRVATSISLVVLLTSTTPWPRLLAALRALFVPREFVLVLGLAYRYLFHLLGSIGEMYEARKARAPRDSDVARGRAFVAATAGSAFGRAHAMSEEVYLAMLARGYNGQVTALDRRRLHLLDLYACAVVVTCVIGAFGVGHVVAH